MTQDEIIEMYLQVSKKLCNDTEWCWSGVGEPLQMFTKLVAAKAEAKEREACAKVILDSQVGGIATAVRAAYLIRARGKA